MKLTYKLSGRSYGAQLLNANISINSLLLRSILVKDNSYEPLKNKDFLNKVFVEKGIVYSLQVDPNDENMKMKRLKMKILK